MSKTTMTFWRGLRTIGGNIAEICYGNDRVIFDFGLVYNPAGSLLEQSSLRNKTYVHDLLRLDMIPAIDGIYSEKDLRGKDYYEKHPITVEQSNYETAVFISHLHLDHMGAIRAISPNVPLYMSEESAQLFEALTVIEEERPLHREMSKLTHKQPIDIGAIKVTPYKMDHDVPGALSLYIETPDLTILYSGDFRMHGENPEWNKRWINVFKEKDVDLLLIEGTTFRPDEEKNMDSEPPLCENEKEFANISAKLIRQAEGLAIFNIYHRNIDRIDRMIEAASLSGRKLVLEPETAYIADQFLNEKDFLVLDYQVGDWVKSLEEKYQLISLDAINRNPNKYVLQNSFQYLAQLLDLHLDGAIYLHANGVPLGDFDPNYEKLLTFLDHFNVKHYSLGVSGHASQEDVLAVIDQIKPNILIPWHSHYPELIKPTDENQVVFLPEAEEVYRYENGTLKKVVKSEARSS